MPELVRKDQMLCIGDTIRIEPGPAPVQAVATAELLGEPTAPHYQAPRTATPEEIEDPGIDTDGDIVYSKDRLGNHIEIGKPFDYLDWVGFVNGDQVFYAYKLDQCTDEELKIRAPRDMAGNPTGEPPADTTIWREISVFPTEEEAISAALSAQEA